MRRHFLTYAFIVCVFVGKAQEDPNDFPKRYKSFGFNLNSLIPKEKTFNYYFAQPNGLSGPYAYDVLYNTVTTQHFNLGLGLDYGAYWKIKTWFNRALYFSTAIELNMYDQKFTKIGQELVTLQPYLFSNITEKSINVLLEPTVKLSYQQRISKNRILNFETGLGINYHVFCYLKKESEDKKSGYSSSLTQYYGPSGIFTKIPLKAEIIFKKAKRSFGIALLSQINDSYAILATDLRDGSQVNSVGKGHDIGINSPAFLYFPLSSNNYPSYSFNLTIQFSIKF